MTTVDDSNESNDNAEIANTLSQSGLHKKFKGKIHRVILKWLAGGIGHPYVKQIRNNLDEIEGRTRVSNLLADEVGRQALADPEVMERAKARFLGDVFRKQENIEAVAHLAQKQLEYHEPLEEVDELEADEPDQDWINAFSKEAENASSEQLRKRLAGLLVGEIKNPGTYSRSTIRLVSEMDQETLQTFHRLLANHFDNSIFREDGWNSGQGFADGVHMENCGLISGSAGFTYKSLFCSEEGATAIQCRKLGLIIKSKSKVEKKIGIWLLTKAGLEIASLLEPHDEKIVLRKIGNSIDKTQLTEIFMGPAEKRGANEVFIQRQEVVWKAS